MGLMSLAIGRWRSMRTRRRWGTHSIDLLCSRRASLVRADYARNPDLCKRPTEHSGCSVRFRCGCLRPPLAGLDTTSFFKEIAL